MNKAEKLISLVESDSSYTQNQYIKDCVTAFEDVLEEMGLGDLEVSVDFEDDNHIVQLVDEDGDEETIVFGFDEEKGFFAIVDSYQENLNENTAIVVDLTRVQESLELFENGVADFRSLGWIDESVLKSLLTFTGKQQIDVDERFKTVIRKGKKVRINDPLVKRRLTSKERAARKKAGRKRRGKKLTADVKKRRAFSNKIRRRTIR